MQLSSIFNNGFQYIKKCALLSTAVTAIHHVIDVKITLLSFQSNNKTITTRGALLMENTKIWMS
jgi:hypothetical protein